MSSKSIERNTSFILDISDRPLGDLVEIVGVVAKQRDFGNDLKGVWIRDITGTILAVIEIKRDPIASSWNPESIWQGKLIRISGKIELNRQKVRVLKKVEKIEILLSQETKLSDLDTERHEKTASMMLSRICNAVSKILRREFFYEFVSKIVSHPWKDEGLEPMQVVFPGFGSSVCLLPSPSAQVTEFLTTTLVSRAFTISKSFTQSFRSTHSSTEISVIVAKATDLDELGQIRILKDIAEKTLEKFVGDINFVQLTGVWPDIVGDQKLKNMQLTEDLSLIIFEANIPVIGKNWDANINLILHLLDRDKNLLAEGSREQLSGGVEISTLTFYPSQFLALVEKAPRRKLQNLMRLYDA